MRLFLDTDIGPDCDDVGAVAVLHALRRRGEIALIGMTHCTSSPYGLPTLSALNRAFGCGPDLGTTKRADFLTGPQYYQYTRAISEEYAHAYSSGAPQPDAAETFFRALSRQEDQSVCVVSIGPLNNLCDFLDTPGGPELIKRKTSRLVLMAGAFAKEEPEWNVLMDVGAAKRVLDEWPGGMVFVPFESGEHVLTGQPLKGCPRHPASRAYFLHQGESYTRMSWDLIAAYHAARPGDPMFRLSPAGVCSVNASGVTRFCEQPGGRHRVLKNAAAPNIIAGALNQLLLEAVSS